MYNGIELNEARLLANNIVFSLAAVLLIAILLCVSLFVAVIPGWTDYIQKDYVVYTGEIEVVDDQRAPQIILQDGTVVSGDLGLDDGEYSETIAYSKRTKMLVGILIN